MDDFRIPAEFWRSPPVVAALADCDIPVLMELIRAARGWTQAELAATLGYSQSWVSLVARGSRSLTIDQVRDIAPRLGIPLSAIRFGGGGGSTKRRQFVKAAASAGIAATLPRDIPSADEETAFTITTITGGQRRLDATWPSRDLVGSAVSHVEMTDRVLRRCSGSPYALQVLASASEAAGFAAWLYADLCDIGSARHYYRLAVRRALQSAHELLAGYMLGSLATFETEQGQPKVGIGLIAEARRLIHSRAPASAHAWLECVEALIRAEAGAEADADRCLSQAERLLDTDESEAPTWPWVFPFQREKIAGYRGSVSVRLQRPEAAQMAFTEALSHQTAGTKQAAIQVLEAARAGVASATQRRDTESVARSFEQARDALRTGIALSSERVIRSAHRFRSAYSGPAVSAVRDFDDEMRKVDAI